jgi:hypothetical protein
MTTYGKHPTRRPEAAPQPNWYMPDYEFLSSYTIREDRKGRELFVISIAESFGEVMVKFINDFVGDTPGLTRTTVLPAFFRQLTPQEKDRFIMVLRNIQFDDMLDLRKRQWFSRKLMEAITD